MSRFQNCPKVVGKDCNWYKTKRMQINNSRDFICILSGIVILLCIYNHRTTKTNQKYPSVNL